MPGIALDSATQGRLRPSFFFLLMVLTGAAGAQQPVFRCGQEYTNAPADPVRCERLSGQAVMVIPGTRVQAAGMPVAEGSAVPPSTPPAGRLDVASQRQRDGMARAIVSAELEKARQRHAQLQQQYQQAQQQDPAAQGQLKAAVERAQRDIDSLQRELDRRPAGNAQP